MVPVATRRSSLPQWASILPLWALVIALAVPTGCKDEQAASPAQERGAAPSATSTQPTSPPAAAQREPGNKTADPTAAAPAGNDDDDATGEPAPADVVERQGEATSGIRWHHDDYAAARAEARTAGKPLVLDFWAPWCHTCLSMKHTVLRSPGLASYADRFVWLAIDTDRPANEAVTKAFPIVFWPTFFVVDPEDESVQARLQGGAPEATFRAFLDQGRSAVMDKRRGGQRIGEDSPLHHLRLAEQLVTAGKLAEADAAYGRALSLGGDEWLRRSDVLVARITTMYKRDAFSDCFAFARAHLADAARSKGAAGADFAYFGDVCGRKGKASEADLTSFRTAAAATVRGVLADPEASLSTDDRGDAMRIVRELLDALGDKAGARTIAQGQRDLLDRAAAAAATPYEAMTYSWPRCEVYAWLGQHAALVPALEGLVAALPDEYDPPYRLAWLLQEHGLSAAALVHARRAKELVYGPRTKRVDSLIEKIEASLRKGSGPTDAKGRKKGG